MGMMQHGLCAILPCGVFLVEVARAELISSVRNLKGNQYVD